jgi:imidazolonepropionase
MSSTSISDAASVICFPGTGPIRGDGYGGIQIIENASVNLEEGRISSIGEAGGTGAFDARGCTVIPGFVDCHTHLPFYGWRADEDAARLAGRRYETLHQEEGGIYRSAQMLSAASDEAVLDFASALAAAMLRTGTTAFETKSGYGLSVDAELRQLRLARELQRRVPQTVVTTCLAAHAVPKGLSAGEWIGRAADELIPVAAEEGLLSAVDIYVESIAFQLEHAARLAKEAEALGLGMRMHADQLEDGQGASFAARWGLVSADHLNHTSLDAVADLAASDTVAVLVPGATFTLRQSKKPPARDLIEAGAIVALGTDLNPGTSPIYSIPLVIALACRLYGLRPLEALAAATANSAYVLRLDDEVGRIAPGYRADLVVLDAPSFDFVTYRPDHDHVLAVFCNGEPTYVSDRGRGRLQH